MLYIFVPIDSYWLLRGDERAVSLVMGRLEHSLWGPRQAAVQALSRISDKGNQKVLGKTIPDRKTYPTRS